MELLDTYLKILLIIFGFIGVICGMIYAVLPLHSHPKVHKVLRIMCSLFLALAIIIAIVGVALFVPSPSN